MSIDWSLISPRDFEQVCAALLEMNGFVNITWYGASGGDKGRDLTATKMDSPLAGIERQTSWIVQCKRYVEKPPSKAEIHAWLVSCTEHHPDNVLLIVTNTLSSAVKDWLVAVQREFRFRIYIWEETQLAHEVSKHRMDLSHLIPKALLARDSVSIYRIHSGSYTYSTNEFEEVCLSAYNCSSPKEAKRKIKAFLEFIRDNDFELD